MTVQIGWLHKLLDEADGAPAEVPVDAFGFGDGLRVLFPDGMLRFGHNVDPLYPLENMLDGDLETYYKGKQVVGTHGPQLDFGRVADIDAIDIYFGDPNGRYLPPAGEVVTSVDRTNWLTQGVFENDQRELHVSLPASVPVRYIQLKFTDYSANTLAIRSFQVAPPPVPLRITSQVAEFGVPVAAYRGITER
ncbi:discoidin domain-containing protein [Nocardia sp. NBC_01009]|uniref:discoidin domain-containing protein n=1 Tax=Nocardia sp. NBC_01009 TaxID=2975996 RepID=UPI0038691F0F|nr:discoidin domain-containing protein [Nocardia sp. NBC_01009]